MGIGLLLRGSFQIFLGKVEGGPRDDSNAWLSLFSYFPPPPPPPSLSAACPSSFEVCQHGQYSASPPLPPTKSNSISILSFHYTSMEIFMQEIFKGTPPFNKLSTLLSCVHWCFWFQMSKLNFLVCNVRYDPYYEQRSSSIFILRETCTYFLYIFYTKRDDVFFL